MSEQRMTTALIESMAHEAFRTRPVASLVRGGGSLEEVNLTKADVQSALKGNEKMLAKYRADLKTLKSGGSVPNLTIAGAQETIQGLEAAIRNQKKHLGGMRESLEEAAAGDSKPMDPKRAVKRFHESLATTLKNEFGYGASGKKRKYRIVTHGLTSAEVHVNGEQAGPGVMTVMIDLKALSKNPPEAWAQLSSKTGTKWSQTVKVEVSRAGWGYLPFGSLGSQVGDVIVSKVPKGEAIGEGVEKTPYDTIVTDKDHLPRKLSARYARELKKGIGKGTKVEVTKSRSTMTRGWDYGNYTVMLITLPGDRGSTNCGFTLHVAQDEASGNVQLDHAYGGVITTARGNSAEFVIKRLISDTVSHLKR